MELFCAAMKRDSITLLRFPFLCNVQVFLCAILSVDWNIYTAVFLPISVFKYVMFSYGSYFVNDVTGYN